MTTENEDYRRGYREAKHKYFNAQKTLEHWKAVVTEDGPEGEEYARLIHGHIHDALNLHPDYLPHEHDDDEDCVVLAELPSTRDLLAKFLHEEVWSVWMSRMFGRLTRGPVQGNRYIAELLFINGHDEQRWKELMEKTYEDLTDVEKTWDQELADKLLMLLEE